jgi:pantoate--beta-alanine ligase
MKIFKEISPLRTYLNDLRLSGKTIGLVPTMGALHRGHLALVKASQADNSVTVSSVFVNPTQFNNAADLSKYPRTLEEDTELLKEVQCDVLFCPETAEMYPLNSTVKIDFGTLDKVLEGTFRPGHFSGVGLVVSKLFNIIQPDRAYFGQKDWQQFAVIRKLVDEFTFPVEVKSIPTLREADGLALSSRNLRLSPDERIKATVFFQALELGKKMLRQKEPLSKVKSVATQMIETIPGVRLEYFEIADSENLTLLENVESSARPILLVAGYVGEIRLIDNMLV